MKNKKFITFSMLILTTCTENMIASHTENIQNDVPVDKYSKERHVEHIAGPAEQTAARISYIASLSGMDDRGIVNRALLKPKKAEAEYLTAIPLDESNIDSTIEIPTAQSINQTESYNLDNIAVAQPIASFTQQASNIVGQGLNFIDTQAQNAGTRLGIPNITGRSRDITNINPYAKAAIKNRFSQNNIDYENPSTTIENKSRDSLKTEIDAHGNISEIYTPAPTRINLPARTIRAWYDKLSILNTPQGRQLFKDAVSARLQRLGNAMPTRLSTQQAFNRFFANITPSMSLPDFNNAINWLSQQLGLSQTEVTAINFDPTKSYENMPTAELTPIADGQLSEEQMMNIARERSLHDNSSENSTSTPVQVQIDSITPISMAEISNSTPSISSTVVAEPVNSYPNIPETFNNK